MFEPWATSVTAFIVARRGSDWLMIRHERLGVTKWELPGGHVDPGETLEQAAARECREESGVGVDVGRLLASCVHEWKERRSRKLICFFEASPLTDATPQAPPEEPFISIAGWTDPLNLAPQSMSAFLHPLVAQQQCGWADAPIHFRMTHGLNDAGVWEPMPLQRR